MSAAVPSLSKTRRSAREWAVIVSAAILIHGALLLFFRPQYLSFLGRDLPDPTGDANRFPYIDSPFQLIPLAPASAPPRGAVPTPADDEAESGMAPNAFDVGEPAFEMLPLPGGARDDGASRRGARSATVQPKPLYIPWPAYPRGAKEVRGTVELLVLVNEKGVVVDIEVSRSLPVEELNRIAVESARRIRFIPGMERGVRTSMWVRLAIGFQPR